MPKTFILVLLFMGAASAHAELPPMTEEQLAQYAGDVANALGLLIAAGMGIQFLIGLGYRLGWLDSSDVD